MSSIRALSGVVLGISLLFMIAGCSDAKQSGQFNPDTGRHGTGWLPLSHAQAVSAGTTTNPSSVSCAECHGSDLKGGISNVSCTSCHLGGPFAAHPAAWTIAVLDHGPTVSQNGTPPCANRYCHGPALTGVVDSGPSCSTCHSMPFDPATIVCGSCHHIPPTGSIFPDIAGKHAQHMALGAYITCITCHQGSDGASGTVLHFNRVVEVAFDPAYIAKSGGTPTFGGLSAACSNISCHGGQVTPNWVTGALDVNVQCSSCHAYGTTQYNSYYTGQHFLHVIEKGVACTACHDTTKLPAAHFTDLNTQAMTQAYLTILNALNYTGTGGGTFGTCTLDCHGAVHNARQW